MKKKILLKTLIPLATFGITLGTALPLASCGAGGGSSSNDDEVAFATEDSLIDYMGNNIPNPGPVDFTQGPYDGSDTNEQMISWIEERLDTKDVLLGLAYCFVATVMHGISNPPHSTSVTTTINICAIDFISFDVACRATFNTGTITLNEHAYVGGDGIKLLQEFIARDSDGNVIGQKFVPLTNAVITQCYKTTEDGNTYKIIKFQGGGTFQDGFGLLTFPSSVWPDVIFPNDT